MKVVDPRLTLKRFVEAHPNQRAAASALGITEGYLSDLLHGRRDLSARLLRSLGLKEIVVES